MPIIDGDYGVECKTNLDHDHWHILSDTEVQEMLRRNEFSDVPDNNKDQIIYIQKRLGIMVVDSDEINRYLYRNPRVQGRSMHELAWMVKNPGKTFEDLKTIQHCPVAGLGYRVVDGKPRHNSGTFNYLRVWII
jgi:hypothetical protein